MYNMRNSNLRYPSRSLGIAEPLTQEVPGDCGDLEFISSPQNVIIMTERPNQPSFHETELDTATVNGADMNCETSDVDIDAVEIIITRGDVSGDINVDIIREASLSSMDFSNVCIIASTFNANVQSKYADIFERMPWSRNQHNLDGPSEQLDKEVNDHPDKTGEIITLQGMEKSDFVSKTGSPGGGDFQGTQSKKIMKTPDRNETNDNSSHKDTQKHVHFAENVFDNSTSPRSRKRLACGHHAKQPAVYFSRSQVDWHDNNETTHRHHEGHHKHPPTVSRAHAVHGKSTTAMASVSQMDISSTQDGVERINHDDIKSRACSRHNIEHGKTEIGFPEAYRHDKNQVLNSQNRHYVEKGSQALDNNDDDDKQSKVMQGELCKSNNKTIANQSRCPKDKSHDKALTNINNANSLSNIPGIIVLKRTPVKVSVGSRTLVSQIDTCDDRPESKNGNLRKQKLKKKRAAKQKRVQPKSELEIFQRQIVNGQLRSMFSKYKTEGLKGLVLKERIYEGTFSVKYKASLQNEQVVASIFTDQDVSDINVLDMAHLRHSYFINGVKDCVSGPCSSLWLLYRHYPLGDLQKLMDRDVTRHVIGERHAQFVTASILMGVEYLHKHDIVHGNIKPSKILISKEGFPVLTGFLKVLEDPDQERRDVYTLAYAAPERFRGDRGPAVDVFSVGCVAYQVVTGSTPFDGGSCEDTRTNILNHSFQPLFEPEMFSFAGEEFLNACLRTNAADRFKLEVNKNPLSNVEWFSSIELKALKKQMVKSPLLEVFQLLDNHARLSCEEKLVEYNWGRVMDVRCPDTPTLDG